MKVEIKNKILEDVKSGSVVFDGDYWIVGQDCDENGYRTCIRLNDGYVDGFINCKCVRVVDAKVVIE